MKTNIIMLSPDRELFGIKIRQQSKTGHLNLTDLQSAYGAARAQHGWSDRNAYDVLGTVNNAERVFYVLQERNLIKSGFSEFMESVEKQGLVKLLKGLAAYKMTGRAETRATWCDPYIWILVAMELNPMLYAKTVVWLTDSLLLNRIEAGNMYRGLSGAVAKFQGVDYSAIAKALNMLVFGRHESGIRQIATAEELRELTKLEENMAFSVEMGFIKSQEQLLEALRQVWRQKFNRAVAA